MKETTKIRTEINEVDTREKIEKINKLLARLRKRE